MRSMIVRLLVTCKSSRPLCQLSVFRQGIIGTVDNVRSHDHEMD
jgi:hypothetical protein